VVHDVAAHHVRRLEKLFKVHCAGATTGRGHEERDSNMVGQRMGARVRGRGSRVSPLSLFPNGKPTHTPDQVCTRARPPPLQPLYIRYALDVDLLESGLELQDVLASHCPAGVGGGGQERGGGGKQEPK
jgi:hypothetical protein